MFFLESSLQKNCVESILDSTQKNCAASSLPSTPKVCAESSLDSTHFFVQKQLGFNATSLCKI